MAGEASFRNHFDMLSLHEPVTKKAKFWQSYVRALKGTEDLRADDNSRRPRIRALSEFPDFFAGRAGYDSDPSSRIYAPGYRYLPVSRDTYGYSPRVIHTYERPTAYTPRAGRALGTKEW